VCSTEKTPKTSTPRATSSRGGAVEVAVAAAAEVVAAEAAVAEAAGAVAAGAVTVAGAVVADKPRIAAISRGQVAPRQRRIVEPLGANLAGGWRFGPWNRCRKGG